MGRGGPHKDWDHSNGWEKTSHVIAMGLLVLGIVANPFLWPVGVILLIVVLLGGGGRKKGS